ncbi:MAG: hypothetical protein WC083_07180 [Candidatus Methanomethylophilaceae archaeon]|jgi:hypothetical protein|nr:hypothetical protein [Fibrobacter sp.]
MDSIPGDVKRAIGKLYVFCSVASDPPLLLRLTRALMSSVRACEAKLHNSIENGTQNIPEWDAYRDKIDAATVAYATSSDQWANVMIVCADVADYFYALCLMDNLIEIDETDFDITSAFIPKKSQEMDNDDSNAGKYLSQV